MAAEVSRLLSKLVLLVTFLDVIRKTHNLTTGSTGMIINKVMIGDIKIDVY